MAKDRVISVTDKDRPCDAFDRMKSNRENRPLNEYCMADTDQIGSQSGGKFWMDARVHGRNISGPVPTLEECIRIPSDLLRAANLKPGESQTRDFSCTPTDGSGPKQTFVIERSCAAGSTQEACDRVKPVQKTPKPK
jgi:hypothetical protein